MNLEMAAALAWKRWSDDSRFGLCQACPEAKLKPVRRRGRSRWLCVECWDQGKR